MKVYVTCIRDGVVDISQYLPPQTQVLVDDYKCGLIDPRLEIEGELQRLRILQALQGKRGIRREFTWGWIEEFEI